MLVNVGRGGCVDGAAVHGALARGELWGFASDVWWNYPKTYDEANGRTPPTDASGDLSFARGAAGARTTLSGHRGGAPGQRDTERRRWAALADALNRAAERGDPADLACGPVGRVDLERGY